MTDKVQTVRAALQEARSGLENLLSNEEMLGKVVKAADLMVASMQQGGKVMSCGNGGSLCDAMHFAEELSGRFRQDRPAYAAMSLADPSHMSCVSNDYGYEDVFSRFVEGIGREGDVLLGITTSGTSKNVVKAAQAAKAKGIKSLLSPANRILRFANLRMWPSSRLPVVLPTAFRNCTSKSFTSSSS